jgi:queuosine precursor transporter
MSEKKLTRENAVFPAIVGCFVACLLISNIVAQKLIEVGPFVFTAGILLFPVTYIIGDVLTEIYGFRRAKQVIWLGFGASLFMTLFLAIVVAIPPADGWNGQESFASTFTAVPRIVLASMAGYLAGEFANSFVLSRLKLRMQGRHLWVRTISSTVIGQGLDTAIFAIIAFGGLVPGSVILTAIWSGYLFKVVYEIMATPLTYLVVGKLRSLGESGE